MENIFITLLLQSVPERTSNRQYGIPKVLKDILIPIGLLEARNSLDPSLDAIDTDVIWTDSHYRTVSLMRFVYRLVLGASISFPKNPYWREGRGEVGVGYFGQGREEGRVDNESVDREQEAAQQCE